MVDISCSSVAGDSPILRERPYECDGLCARLGVNQRPLGCAWTRSRRLWDTQPSVSDTASRQFEWSLRGSPLRNSTLVLADVARIFRVNVFQFCVVPPPEFVAVMTRRPLTRTTTVLLVPKRPLGSTTLPTENLNVYLAPRRS